MALILPLFRWSSCDWCQLWCVLHWFFLSELKSTVKSDQLNEEARSTWKSLCVCFRRLQAQSPQIPRWQPCLPNTLWKKRKKSKTLRLPKRQSLSYAEAQSLVRLPIFSDTQVVPSKPPWFYSFFFHPFIYPSLHQLESQLIAGEIESAFICLESHNNAT